MKFKCSICKKEANADPSWIVDVAITLEDIDPAEAERRTKAGGTCLSYDEFRAVSEHSLIPIGITPAQRDALLRGEPAYAAKCICPACQEKLEVEE